MPTKLQSFDLDSQTDPQQLADNTPDSSPDAVAPARRRGRRSSIDSNNSSTIRRFSLPLSADGETIDVRSLKEEQLEKLRKMLHSAEGRDAIGDAAKAIPAFKFNPEASQALLDSYVDVLRTTVHFLKRKDIFEQTVPPMSAFLQFTPDQHNKLDEPLCRVVEQYAPFWFIKHQALAAFMLILSKETKAMITNAANTWASIDSNQQLVREYIANKNAAAVRPNGVDNTNQVASDVQ